MARQWTQDLAVGVQDIDTQHKALFEKINGLLAAMSQGEGMQEIGPMLDFLARYVKAHFATEEQYMTQHGYPHEGAHRQQHQQFIRDFGTWVAQFQAKGASTKLVLDVHRKLSDWLVNHITGTDIQLGTFLQARLGRAVSA